MHVVVLPRGYQTTAYPTNMLMLAIFLCRYDSIGVLQSNYFQEVRNPCISSIDFSEHNLHLCWSHCKLTLCKSQLPHAKLVETHCKFGRSCSSQAIMEAMSWSQTLSLVDKCRAQMCEYP